MLFRIFLTILTLALTLANGPCEPETVSVNTVSGIVEGVQSAQGIAGVRVSWGETSVVTGGNGNYKLSVPAGIRKIAVELPDGRTFFKVIRTDGDRTQWRLDFLIPAKTAPGRRWVVEMKPPHDSQGNALDSDFQHQSRLWITDYYFNDPEPVPTDQIGGDHCSPRWSPAGDIIAFAAQTIPASRDLKSDQGIWLYDPEFRTCNQLARMTYPFYIDWHPNGRALVVASQNTIRVVEMNLKNPDTPPRQIFNITPEQGILLSVCWATPDKILATWDGPAAEAADPIRERISRIVQLNPDRQDQEPEMFTEPDRSVRYPISVGSRGGIVYTSFVIMSPEGRMVYRSDFPDGEPEVLLDHGTHPVWRSEADGSLVFLQNRDLFWKSSATGPERCLLPSVMSAHLSPLPWD